MASKLKLTSSPNQPGISDFIAKHSNTPQSRSNSSTSTPVAPKVKRSLSSPEMNTPPPKKLNLCEQLPPELKLLYDSLSQRWDECLDPLESKVNALFSEDSKLPQHIEEVKEIKRNQTKIETRLTIVEKENIELKQKLSEIEGQLVENCVIMSGIKEQKWEEAEPRRVLINNELLAIAPGSTNEEKLNHVQDLHIVRTERVGRYNPAKNRPISIKFGRQRDVDWLLSSRKDLKKGIYVEKQYSEEAEYQRKRLRPILSAARRLEEYRGKCTMDGTAVKINGKQYTWNNLHELPENLSPHVVSSRQNADYYGFFGEMNPLSNFHPAPFYHNGVQYETSEQYIQARKAEFSGDEEIKSEILLTKSALRCKQFGKEVRNCDTNRWNAVAAEYCYPGILSKFQQNPGLASFLKKTGSKTIIECCYDNVWGCGTPLSNPDCIKPTENSKQGILGELLERVREELLRPPPDLSSLQTPSSESMQMQSMLHVGTPAIPNP